MKENVNKIYIIIINNLFKLIIIKNKFLCIQKIRYIYCNLLELFLKNKIEFIIVFVFFIFFVFRDLIKFD